MKKSLIFFVSVVLAIILFWQADSIEENLVINFLDTSKSASTNFHNLSVPSKASGEYLNTREEINAGVDKSKFFHILTKKEAASRGAMPLDVGDENVIRAGYVCFDQEILSEGKMLKLELFDGETIKAVFKKKQAPSTSGNIIWTGEIEGLSHGTIKLVGREGVLMGFVHRRGKNEINIAYRGKGIVSVSEMKYQKHVCNICNKKNDEGIK